MSDVDSDFDEEAHSKLLETIKNLGKDVKKKSLIKKCKKKVEVRELVEVIHSTKNVDDVKKKFVTKRRKAKKGRGKINGAVELQTLQTPTHRLARERIESSIAYNNIRDNLEEWAPVVNKNRLAEQLIFPLDKDPPVERTASERILYFKPRTPLEIKMAKLLSTSKNNLHDDEKYTEAELELLRAMSLKEAKAKWAQLQKMRALISYREAKLKRQAKIKSKSYHRHLKRQKRKKLIKEFEEMMLKDPEAAKEKLEEIDRQRILERATLKHRNGGKRVQQLARYASKNKEFKKTYEEQIRLGRELVEKHGREKDSDTEPEKTDVANLCSAEMLQKAAEILEKEELETRSKKPNLGAKLHEMRRHDQEIIKKSAVVGGNALVPSTSSSALVAKTSDTEHETVAVECEMQKTSCNDEQSEQKPSKQIEQQQQIPGKGEKKIDMKTTKESKKILKRSKRKRDVKELKKKVAKTSAVAEHKTINLDREKQELSCDDEHSEQKLPNNDKQIKQEQQIPDRGEQKTDVKTTKDGPKKSLKKAKRKKDVKELKKVAKTPSAVAEHKAVTLNREKQEPSRNDKLPEQQQQTSNKSIDKMDIKTTGEGSKKILGRAKKKKGIKRLEKEKRSLNIKELDIDSLFDKAEKKLAETVLKECEQLEKGGKVGLRNRDHSLPEDDSITIPRKREKMETTVENQEVSVDISLDPRHFLQIETNAIPQVSADLVENFENSDEEVETQETVIAKAFEDVDVIGDFEAEKEAVEEAEKPKDLDLTLQGWGTWTGPGISDKKNDRFVIKAKKKVRKDAGRTGLIISEIEDHSIEKFQLKSVPFPYTSVEDYEAVVRQPLGKEWNPQRIHKKLIKPQIVVKAGRIIKPLDKSALQSEFLEEKESNSKKLF